MPAANKNIRPARTKNRLLPVAMGIGLILGSSLFATSMASAETLSMATAKLSPSEATDAMAHGGSLSQPVPMVVASAAPVPTVSAPASQPVAKPAAPMVVASIDDDEDDEDNAAMQASDRAAEVSKSISASPPAPSNPSMDDDADTDDTPSPQTQAAASSGSWFSNWFSWGSKSSDNDDMDDDTDEDTSPATRAAARAPGQIPETSTSMTIPAYEKNKNEQPMVTPAQAVVEAKSQAAASQAPIPHSDVFVQPQSPAVAQTSPVLPMAPQDQGNIRPEQARAWAEDLQMLERENQALREKLHIGEADPLGDIKVDAVSQIHEDVLRARVVELEKELDKLHMKHDPGDLPQKSAPARPSASNDTAVPADPSAPASATP